jgi:phospholipase D1/2
LPDSGGPREPWHDWHCKIEGHAAYDVLTNFEQRWRKATRLHDEELLDIDRRENLMGPSNRAPISGDPALFLYSDFDSETWNVQVGFKISLCASPNSTLLDLSSFYCSCN